MHERGTLGFLKIVGGIVIASLGFVGMAIAVMRYFIGRIQEISYIPSDLSSGSLIALGIISFMVFMGGVYLILHYGLLK